MKAKKLAVTKIDTKKNWSDIFTKPVPDPQFSTLRDEMMGWTKLTCNPFTEQPILNASTSVEESCQYQSNLALSILDAYVLNNLNDWPSDNLFPHVRSESQTELNKTRRSSNHRRKRSHRR